MHQLIYNSFSTTVMQMAKTWHYMYMCLIEGTCNLFEEKGLWWLTHVHELKMLVCPPTYT